MKTNPYLGLNKINKEEYINSSPFEIYQKVDELAPSYQKGQTSDMFLFLFLINILVKAKVEFLVNGGIILSMFFNEHIRRTKDIDVIAKDPKILFDQITAVIDDIKGDIVFKAKWVRNRPPRKIYYYHTFSFLIEAYHHNELFKSFLIDGKVIEHYEDIEKVKYLGPKIIDEDFYFYGVNKEYNASDKILAVSSEHERPIKHLIDVYTFSHIDLDIILLKKILKTTLQEENKVRRRLNIPTLKEDYLIKKDKIFFGNYLLSSIGAGYRLNKEEMISAVNDWIKNNL